MSEIKCNKLEITSLRQCDSIKSRGNIGPCIIEGPARQDSCQACQPPPQLLDLACHTHSDQPCKNCSLHWFLGVFIYLFYFILEVRARVQMRRARGSKDTMNQVRESDAAAFVGRPQLHQELFFFSSPHKRQQENHNTHSAPCFSLVIFSSRCGLEIPTSVYKCVILGVAGELARASVHVYVCKALKASCQVADAAFWKTTLHISCNHKQIDGVSLRGWQNPAQSKCWLLFIY